MTYKHKRRVQIKSCDDDCVFFTNAPSTCKEDDKPLLSTQRMEISIWYQFRLEIRNIIVLVSSAFGLWTREIVAVPWVPGKQHFGTILLLTFCGIRAFAVPFLFPVPVWRPFLRARVFFLHRAREWTATGLRIIKPSFMSLRTFCPEKTTTAS